MAVKDDKVKSKAKDEEKDDAKRAGGEDFDPSKKAGDVKSDPDLKGVTEPKDPAPGKPKVDEDAPADQKLAGGTGLQTFAASMPLIQGIPVVVPVGEASGIDPANLVMGVVLGAPVAPGVPEMIGNAQAEYAVEHQDWNEGDVKSVSFNQGETLIDRVQEDGSVKTERHRSDPKVEKELNETLAKGDPKKGRQNLNSFAKKAFTEKTLIEEPA